MERIHLSDGEWKLMKLLWEASPRTIAEMVRALAEDTGWSKTTVFVMLHRLMDKGAVRLDDSGRVQHYYPLLAREDAANEQTSSFLGRVYDGSIGLMMSALADRCALSKEDIAELRRILDDAERAVRSHGEEKR